MQSFGSDLKRRDEELYAALAATHTVRAAVASGKHQQQQHGDNHRTHTNRSPSPYNQQQHELLRQQEALDSGQAAVARLSDEPVGWDAPESPSTCVYFGQGGVQFRPVLVGTTKAKKARICNKSASLITVEFGVAGAAFTVSHRSITIQPLSYVQLPVLFAPPTSGHHRGTLLASFNSHGTVIELALPLQGSTKDLVWK